MSGMAQGAGTGARDRMALAVILIGLGLLGAFAYTRQYGDLIPGGIMTGLGAGIISSEAFTFATDEASSGAIVLGLGLGFLSIWVIGAIVRIAQNHWWPVIPGGILAVVGGALLVGGQAGDLLDYWGVVVIAVGVFVLWRAGAGARSRVET